VSWDPYLDLQSGVLRNRLGITDAGELARVEAELTSYRLIELSLDPLPGSYDLAHLQAFHRYIFGDLYDWSGQLRTVSIGKGALYCLTGDLVSTADEVFGRLAHDRYLQGRDRAGFVTGVTALLSDINALHPFREGNGPTQRAFVAQLSRAAGYLIRWRDLEPEANAAASAAAHRDGDTMLLRAMLDRLVDSLAVPPPRTPEEDD
jgi:cell filamentation protein, protein adenylyltransferase